MVSQELKSKLYFIFILAVRSEGDYKLQYNNGKGNVEIDYNICEYAFRRCPDGGKDYANVINENNTCSHLSSGSIHDVVVSLIDPDKGELGMKLLYKGGNYCNDTHPFSLLVQLNCDKYATVTTYDLDTSSIVYPCSPRVIMSSKEACPVFALHTLWKFFDKYNYLAGLVMVFFGLYLLIWGGRFYKITMFIAG